MGRARAVVMVLLALMLAPAAAQAAFPGENGRIAFSAQDGDNDVYVLEPDGTTIRPITSNSTSDTSPDLSPDATKVAWEAGLADRNDILVAPADGSGTPVNISEAGANVYAYSPAWSPDGTKIAFVLEGSGNVWIAASDGTGDPVQITSNTGVQDIRELSWSPDGTTIAFSARLFISPGNFNRDLYTVPAAGGQLSRLTTATTDERSPDWSPNGATLVFTSDRDAANPNFPTFDGYSMPAAGGDVTRLTTEGTTLSPVYSPDGTRILYSRSFQLHTIPAAGGTPVPIEGIENPVLDADWGAPGPQPPQSLTKPLISGNVVTGGLVSCSDGTWNGAPTQFAYAWKRDGATTVASTQQYTIVAADEGKALTCTVTATNAVGDTSATSDPITPQAAGTTDPPSNVGLPIVSGTPMHNQSLASTVGQWDGTPTITYARQWLRCDADGNACEPIAGATGETYLVVPEDIGRRLRLRVTATNAAASVAEASAATAVVTAEPPRNLSPPVLSGTAESGKQLSVTTGDWAGTEPLTFTYRWIRCYTPYAFAIVVPEQCTTMAQTGPTYNPGETDKAKRVYAVVTATNAAGAAEAASTAVRVAGDIPCELADSDLAYLCGKTPVVFIPGFGASAIRCTNVIGLEANLWPAAVLLNTDFIYMQLATDGVSPGGDSRCSQSASANGEVVETAAGFVNIHGVSQAWLRSVGQGRAYVFGWDWRKGPDQSLQRLDDYIDRLRARHGVKQVAILNHSYGGILTRWYIDSPGRAAKVARVANIATPFWGSPKAWFAMAHGYETPAESDMDKAINNLIFKAFVENLTGLYYLFPSRSWFDAAPTVLRKWLEVGETPRSFDGVLSEVSNHGGNRTLALRAADGHRDHVDGFKGMTRAGVDWRTFVGSGLPTLGHIREGADLQYSWINGDGTVPLISQRQFASDPARQLGERVPTYYTCGIAHLDEPEDAAVQRAIQGFLFDGADVPVNGAPLRSQPCALAATEYRVTDADRNRLGVQAAAEGSGARASAAPMRLDQAESAGLVDVVGEAGAPRTFVTSTGRPISVTLPKGAAIRITPITGDGKAGTPVQFGPLTAPATITTTGAKVTRAVSRGRTLRPRKLDRKAPRTRARVRRRGSAVLLSPVAKDASGVRASFIRVGSALEQRWRKPVRVSRTALRTVRIRSVDIFGNAERPKRVRG